MDCKKYIEYVNNNTESIAAYVDACFEEQKEFIKARLVKLIKDSITPLPTHYVLTRSGKLAEEGTIDTTQAVEEFLKNEYTGGWRHPSEKDMGKRCVTYDEALVEDIMDWGYSMMLAAIRRCIETEFSVSLSDDEFAQIVYGGADIDPTIIDNCKASDFYFPSTVAEFVGIDQLKLSEL